MITVRVPNTDAFDKRRFNEIYEISQGLQKISGEGEVTNVRTTTRRHLGLPI